MKKPARNPSPTPVGSYAWPTLATGTVDRLDAPAGDLHAVLAERGDPYADPVQDLALPDSPVLFSSSSFS